LIATLCLLLLAGSATSATARVPHGPAEVLAGSQAPRPPGGIWHPRPGTTWQWQIVGRVAPPFQPVQMYDIDLQDAVPRRAVSHFRLAGRAQTVVWDAGLNAGVIDQLHRAGKVVVCYLDSGAAETYRPDWRLFPRQVILNSTGWGDEYWLDIRPGRWQLFAPIIWARFALAKQIGCDGVEPDVNNPVGNVPRSLGISYADERTWYLEVATMAHHYGLSVGMKNGIEPAVTDAATVRAFDWNLNEECFFFEECATLRQFIDAGKAVFQTEYTSDWATRSSRLANPLALQRYVCALTQGQAYTKRFSVLVKRHVPDGLFLPC
jgi:hypothetical protein